MADPDEALIEAIAAEACEPDANFMFCTTHQTDSGQWPCPVGPRAVWAAVVEHLGLVEETQSGCGHHIGNCFKPEHHDRWVKRRLVSRWTEVDHGSE